MSVVNLKQPPRDPNWRVGFIGGSDAVKIMSGNWHDLYNEKTGKHNLPIYLTCLMYS